MAFTPRRYKEEWQNLKRDMPQHWNRFKADCKRFDLYEMGESFTNLFTETCRSSPYIAGHVLLAMVIFDVIQNSVIAWLAMR